jgi:hypothetical protein
MRHPFQEPELPAYERYSTTRVDENPKRKRNTENTNTEKRPKTPLTRHIHNIPTGPDIVESMLQNGQRTIMRRYHNRRTHRQVTERHTSYSSPMRNNTRPSVIHIKRRTKHQRPRHPSEASEWYAPHTDRTRTHHARPSRINHAPRCRVIQTTRTTKGYRHR